MKLIKPSFEIWEQPNGLEGVYKQIEKAGRICYKSEDRITEDSAKGFVDRMINSKHLSTLEHGTVYLKIDNRDDVLYKHYLEASTYYYDNPYSKVETNKLESSHTPIHYVTTNFRVLIENDRLSDLKYICEPTEYHEKRVTVHFVCDRGISHEFVKHRVFSFTQESTRYCNYSKDKFNNELTFIIPCWIELPEGHISSKEFYIHEQRQGIATRVFLSNLYWAESNYLDLISQEWKSQQARVILPNALKTELIMTGTIEQWEGFFKLRCAKDAHPQARELAIPLKDEFIKKGYLNG